MTTKEINPMKSIDLIAAIFLFIGGINWGLVGMFDFDIIGSLFGTMSVFSRIIYILVAVSAIYDAVAWKFIQRRWECSDFFSKPGNIAA